MSVSVMEWKWDLPDVLAFHIKQHTRLDQVTACKFFEHSIIVLGIVAGDVPNLDSPKLVV
jgi:hypothetical protein